MLDYSAATVRDTYTTLNFLGVVGNTMIRRLIVGGSEPMPSSVTCEAVQSLSGKELAESRQPSVDIDSVNRTIVLTFPAPAVRSDAAHIIYFDSRRVLAGKLYFGYETTSDPDATSETVYLPTASNTPVYVSVLIGASAGGGADTGVVSLATNEAIPAGRLVVNIGGKASLYNALTPTHAYALIGISTQSAPVGGVVDIRTKGTVVISGWGLTSGQTYRAGQAGNLSTSKPAGGFSQIVGRAISADSFLFNPQPIIY